MASVRLIVDRGSSPRFPPILLLLLTHPRVEYRGDSMVFRSDFVFPRLRRLSIVGIGLAALVLVDGHALAQQTDPKQTLDRLNQSAANFHATAADVEYDTRETDPVPDEDIWKGKVYYERKGSNSVSMGVHFDTHNGKPTGKTYTYIGGTFKLFEPNMDQVTTHTGAAKFESYVILGFGASGKDLEAKWDITDLGPETISGIKTEKLDLVAKDPAVRKSVQKVTIWVDPDRAVSLKQVFTLSATTTWICTYSNFKLNQPLPSDAFTFKTDSKTTYEKQ
jgi:outer membrane lipoprotein-sorting protein